jgi:hypothetical protein
MAIWYLLFHLYRFGVLFQEKSGNPDSNNQVVENRTTTHSASVIFQLASCYCQIRHCGRVGS